MKRLEKKGIELLREIKNDPGKFQKTKYYPLWFELFLDKRVLVELSFGDIYIIYLVFRFSIDYICIEYLNYHNYKVRMVTYDSPYLRVLYRSNYGNLENYTDYITYEKIRKVKNW